MYETDLVTQAGLTQGEAKVYLALLELGSATAGPIIEKSKVARSFVYNILNGLIDKGLVSFVMQEKVRHYQAAEPSRILDHIEREKNKLEVSQEKIEELLPKLLLLQQMSPTTNFAMFQGWEGIQTCFERNELKLKRGDEHLSLGIVARQDEKHHAYWQRDHEKRAKKGIGCRMLFNSDTPRDVLENRNGYKGCDARYMSADMVTPAWFFIYADVVVICLQETTPLAIEITNAEVAATFREYFEDYWKRSKKFA